MMTNWTTNLEFAHQRHTADVARAERHRLVRRSRRAGRPAARVAAPAADAPLTTQILVLPRVAS